MKYQRCSMSDLFYSVFKDSIHNDTYKRGKVNCTNHNNGESALYSEHIHLGGRANRNHDQGAISFMNFFDVTII
jgi:hypothetical protein